MSDDNFQHFSDGTESISLLTDVNLDNLLPESVPTDAGICLICLHFCL